MTSGVLTLMFIGNVVLSFSVNQQRWHEERLVQLILQVDVVVAWRERGREHSQEDMKELNDTPDHWRAMKMDENPCHTQTPRSFLFHSPGLMADTGRIRWPINLPFSSNTAILSEASVGRTTWGRHTQAEMIRKTDPTGGERHFLHNPKLPY